MGLEYLERVHKTSIVFAGVAAVLAATYRGPLAGLGLALGAAWSLANLALLQRLVVAITSPERGTWAMGRRAAIAIGLTLLLFAAGGVLLVSLPPLALAAGFTVPFAVMVAKAASLLLLESRAWRAITSSPWRAALVVSTLLVAAWWVVPSLVRPGRAADEHRHGAVVDSAEAHRPGHSSAAPGGSGAHGGDDHGAGESHTGEAHGAGGAHGASQGPQKFANVITVLARAFPDAGWAHWLHEFEAVIFSMLVAGLLGLAAFAASRRPAMIPKPLQNAAEMVVEGLYDFIVSILGPRHGPRFVPFLGTLFVYIFAMNVFGLIPFMDSPTSSLNVTFGLGLTVFLYSQWIGIRGLGFVGYVDHLMGSPRDLTSWMLVPLMLPIHVLGELAKPISLSCRLFGNIFGEDMLMVAFATLGIGMLAFANLPFGLPMHAIFFPLALLTSVLQALVFTVLSTIYFLLMLPHDEHHGEEAHAHH